MFINSKLYILLLSSSGSTGAVIGGIILGVVVAMVIVVVLVVVIIWVRRSRRKQVDIVDYDKSKSMCTYDK